MCRVIIDRMHWNNTFPRADSCRILTPDNVNTHRFMITPIYMMKETIFSCPHTFRFRTHLLTGTTSGMASDCGRGRGTFHEGNLEIKSKWGYGNLFISEESAKKVYDIVNLTQLV